MSAVIIEIDTDLCDNTQACEAVCPESVFLIVNGKITIANKSACTVCFKCMENCPSGAVTIDY
ncbi:MAG: 4Fe-4S dicluster domain-containing protein [Acidobacteriota bacterium]